MSQLIYTKLRSKQIMKTIIEERKISRQSQSHKEQ